MRLDDATFVNHCLEGDEAAFTCLVNEYKEMVHAYAYYRIGDYQEAEDITQEVFIKAYRKLGQLRWPHRFQSWLYTIVSNECKMWLRQHSKEHKQEISWEDVSLDELNGLALRTRGDEEMKDTVESAMESLPADSQLALSLFYISGLSAKEIAHFMGVSAGNMRVKLHHARKQLGERLEKMLGRQLGKERLKAGFIFKVVDSIKNMPKPSLPRPPSSRWLPISISVGVALLIGIVGYGVSSGKDVLSNIPILNPAEAIFEVSLLPDPDRQIISDTEPENIINLVAAGVDDPEHTQPTVRTKSSGIIVRRIWENAQYADAVSPDGRYVSYVNQGTGNLGIHDFETGESRDVTDEGTWAKLVAGEQYSSASIWSPESKQIAYLWYDPKGSSLRIVGVDGAKPRVLCSSSRDSGTLYPRAWSRDGKHILVVHCKGKDETHSHDLVLVSVADSSTRVLKSTGQHIYEMSLSPDGRYVVYEFPQSEDSPKGDIFLLATDGSREMTLVEHPANDGTPFWAPDGNRIMFASNRSGSTGLWVLKVVDGKPKGSPQLISDNLNGMNPLGLTQDGSYYYRLRGRENDIYFADLDGKTGKAVRSPTKAVQNFEGYNGWSHFSPDGKRLVYISRRGNWPFVVRSLETGEERELQPDLPFDLLAASAPRWSPDGLSILVLAKFTDSAKKTRLGFLRIHVETGAVVPVVLDDEQSRIFRPIPPVCSPDGSEIFFFRQGGGLRIYDLDAKQEKKPDFQWPERGRFYASGLALSPNGGQLACIATFDDGSSLCIAPSTGGEAQELHRLPKEEIPPWPDGMWLVWTPDGGHLLFARRRDEATELWRISVDGGEPENLGLAMGKIEHLSIHPDGRRIAFTGPGPTLGDEVWVMENVVPTSTASR